VSVTLSAADNTGGSGVAATYYTTDGSTPTTSSPRYTTALSLSTTTTVRYFSTDVVGNAEAVKSQVISIDVTAPTSTIACNGTGCTGSAYPGPVTVTMAATDNPGGSGVSSIHYTTNGTNPTLASPTYTGPFTVAVSTQIRYASWDVAGNAEASKTRSINVVDNPPTAKLTVTPTSGRSPLLVTANASASTDTDGTPISTYQFDFGDGTSLAAQSGATATHTYTKAGTFTVTVTVRDTANQSSKATVQVVVSK
jgi:PKD repeat protein